MHLILGVFGKNLSAEQSSKLKRAHESFSMAGQRELVEIFNKPGVCEVYGNQSHLTYSLSKSENRFSFYSGYTFENSKLSLQKRLDLLNHNYETISHQRYAHNFLRISYTGDYLTIESDIMGSAPLFYVKEDNAVFFSSEIEPLLEINSNFKINRQALHHFLNFGFSFPAETLDENLLMIRPGRVHRFSTSNILNEETIEVDYRPAKYRDLSLEKAAKALSEDLKHSIEYMAQECRLKTLSLRPNLETRFIIDTLSEKNHIFIEYVANNPDLPTKHEYFGIEIAKLLAEKYSLNLKIKNNSPFEFSFENYFKRFKHPFIMSNFASHAKDFFSGECLNSLPFRIEYTDLKIENPIFKFISEQYNADFVADYDKAVLASPTQNKELYFAMLAFRSSFISNIFNGDPFWATPYLTSPKKISPFNTGELLWEICHLPMEFIRNGNLLTEMLKNLSTKALSIPFHDSICQRPDFPFKKATDTINTSNLSFRESSYQTPLKHLTELVSIDYYWKQEDLLSNSQLFEAYQNESDYIPMKLFIYFLYKRYYYGKFGDQFLTDLNPENVESLRPST